MSHYYLSPYVGTGTDDDPFRPKGIEGRVKCYPIDLRGVRPDGTQVEKGFAFMGVDTPDPSIGPYLGDDPDSERPGLRAVMRGNLGVMPEATRLRDILAELLIVHGKEDGSRWKPLRRSRDGLFAIWLNGQRWGAFLPI